MLPQAHGYPVRVVIPGLYGYVSATKWVVDMEFTTFDAFSAYWVKQKPAWSQQAPIKTESRIDVPKRRSTVTAGQVTVAGVAWAQRTGIEAVEVGINGVFHEAKLPPRTRSTPGASGPHLGRHPWPAHAPGAGHQQERLHPDLAEAPDRPDGATGYHRSWSTSPEPADGAHPLCAPSARPVPPGRRSRTTASGPAGW